MQNGRVYVTAGNGLSYSLPNSEAVKRMTSWDKVGELAARAQHPPQTRSLARCFTCSRRSSSFAMVLTNRTCPNDNKEVIDQSSFWDADGINWDAHRIGWAIAGGCAALVCGASIVPEFSHVYLAL